MLRKLLIIWILLLFSLASVFAQQRQEQRQQRQGFSHEISGKVICSVEKLPMPMVAVGIEELNLWTVTNMDGEYILKNLPAGRHKITVRCLGYTTHTNEVEVPSPRPVNINLTPASLALGEVTVTAQRGTGIATSTTIGRSAIEHTQPTSITDVLQLLPGAKTFNPDMGRINQLHIRENVGTMSTAQQPSISAMASLGTGLRIDGAPVSNTANMQRLGNSGVYQSTAGSGVDMREFSVDNIESIEVVRGIAGAEEGDILSGVVKIHTIKGATPLTTRLKVDPNNRQAYMGKGFLLGGAIGGTLNLNGDILQSMGDIRFPYEGFNRYAGSAAYNNTFFRTSRPLVFSFSAFYSETRNGRAEDPDRLRTDERKSRDRSLRLITSGGWTLNTWLITNLNWNFSLQTAHNYTYEYTLRSIGSVTPTGFSRVSGEYEGIYLTDRFYSAVTIDGRPLSFTPKLSASRIFELGKTRLTIRSGVDYSYSQNNGKGTIFDINQPPTGGFRPRPFYDIPGWGTLSFWAEELLSVPIGSTHLELQAGLRFDNRQPSGPFTSSEGITSLDPRINARYSIFKKRDHLVSDLGMRLGFGRSTTTPTLVHIYPDKIYSDQISFNYYDFPYMINVMTTFVVEDVRNYDLRPAAMDKWEAGLDIKIGRADVQLTGFYERMSGGFSSDNIYFPRTWNLYGPVAGGLFPTYIPGTGVVYNDPQSGQQVLAPVTQRTRLASYSYPVNGGVQTKQGIEFDIDFGRVQALQTNFMLNGAYLFTHNQNFNDYYWTSSSTDYQVAGLYVGGQGGTLQDRLLTTLRTVTHIRPLALVVSLTAQASWFESSRNTQEDVNGNILVYTLEPTDDIYKDIRQIKYYHPAYVMDISGELKPWLPEYATTMPYAALIRDRNPDYFVRRSSYPAFQLDMRLTKELSRTSTISFSVRNFTYYKPLQKTKGASNEGYTRRNNDMYFSGELAIKI